MGCGTGGITPEAYREMLRSALPGTLTESVPVGEAVGRTLAQDVRATADAPAFDNSAMDGFAISAPILARLQDGSVAVMVAAEVAAGSPAVAVPRDRAVQIMTGAPVAPGTAAVVPVELTSGFARPGDWVELRSGVRPGAHIRVRGEDIVAGATVLGHGTKIGPRQVAVLAAFGHREVVVRQRPRALVVVSGTELAETPDADAGQICDSNGPMLRALLEAAGVDVVEVLRVPDDPRIASVLMAERVVSRLAALAPQPAEPAEHVDLIVTCGGISAGRHEVVRDVVGAQVDFVHVAMRPGGPQGCGSFRGVPTVCLPGNPVSAMVSFEVLLAPMLIERSVGPTGAPADLPAGVERRSGLTQYVVARTGAGGVSVPVAPGRSGSLAALANGDHLVVVPPLENPTAAVHRHPLTT